MSPIKNILGQKFGKWLVIELCKDSNNKSYWLCKCECGSIKRLESSKLRRGETKSCIKCVDRNHGYRNTPTYSSWYAMKSRVNNKNHRHYDRYGGAGITICDDWQSFVNFLKDMGERPENHTLDRINGNGNYEPSNCRWATKDQQQNNMKSNRHFKSNGEILSASQWARKIGIHKNTFYDRWKKNNYNYQLLYVEIENKDSYCEKYSTVVKLKEK